MFPMEHGSKTQKRASFHVQFPPLSLEEMAWNFYKLFPAKGWCHLYSIFCTWGIHKDVFLDTIGISFWLLVFLNGFPSKVFVEKWSVSIWMKHVVTMKYWLINDGTFCCGFWMISIQLRSIIPYHFYSSYTHFGMTSFIKVPSSFVWPSLWLVKYWWGDFFLIWSCCQICFWLCFPTIEMSSALCVSLIPWILWGIWNEESIFHWFKKHVHIFGGVTKHFEVLHAIQNLMTNARCMPSGQLTSSWVSSWSILDTRQGTLAGSWVTANCVGCEVLSNVLFKQS